MLGEKPEAVDELCSVVPKHGQLTAHLAPARRYADVPTKC